MQAFQVAACWNWGALIHERKLTLSEVRFEIDNWPKVGDVIFHGPMLMSEKIQYFHPKLPMHYTGMML